MDTIDDVQLAIKEYYDFNAESGYQLGNISRPAGLVTMVDDVVLINPCMADLTSDRVICSTSRHVVLSREDYGFLLLGDTMLINAKTNYASRSAALYRASKND